MSFSAGASRNNIASLLAAGMQTITVCSDLLRTGGYLRFADYVSAIDSAMDDSAAASLDEFIVRSAGDGSDSTTAAMRNLAAYAADARSDPDNAKNGFDKTHEAVTKYNDGSTQINAVNVRELLIIYIAPRFLNKRKAGGRAEKRNGRF